MSLHDAIENDFAVIDETKTVSLVHGGTTTQVAGVTHHPLSREAIEELANSFGLESTYRGFSLPVANLAGVSPRPGDRIIDSSATHWRLLSAKLVTVGTRWVVMCIERK